jgi:lysophospholipase L1-like esterase
MKIKSLFISRAVMLSVALLMTSTLVAQKSQYANYARYAKANAELGSPQKSEKRVVFMGNSITDGWVPTHPDFFKNGFIGRGISGQTSDQFLLRFRQDVINLKPKVVVINYGTNDIAENNGPYNEDVTFGNVVSMVELAKANKIKVVLASCLPAGEFPWRKSITGAIEKIKHLNARVKAYAEANKIPYADYFSSLLSADGTRQNPDYTRDGVHPNGKGYTIMENVVTPIVNKLRK